MKVISKLALVSLAVGCGARTPQESISSLKHDYAQPTRHTDAGAWATLSDSEYRNFMAPLVGVELDTLVESSDPLTKRAQKWLDIFDSALRAQQPARMADVPRPKAQVVKTTQVNAFVGKVVSCFTGPTTSQGEEAVQDAKATFLDFGSGGAIHLTAEEAEQELGDIPCRPLNNKLAEAQSLAKVFNNSNSVCTMKVTGSGTAISRVDFTGSCVTAGQSNKLYVVQVADIVHFFTGIYDAFKEENFAAVVAHELGHYYRTHGLESGNDFEFFYKLSETNADHRPLRDPQYDSMIPEVKISSEIIEAFSMLRKVPQQTYHSSAYISVGGFVKNLCPTAAACPAACTDAVNSVRSANYMRELGAFPFSEVANANVGKYIDHESRMNRCLDAIAVTNTNRTSVVQALAKAIAQPSWPQFLVANPNPTLRQAIGGFQQVVFSFLLNQLQTSPETFSTATSAGAIAREFSRDIARKEQQSLALYDRVFSNHLGQYTAEQEADELSVEWLALSGISPRRAVDTYLEFARQDSEVGSGSPFHDIDFANCKALFDSHWRNEQGEYQYIAMGSLLDSHHGSCYRAFNTDREIVAHHVAAQGSAPAMLADGTWPSLQAHAHELGRSAPPPPVDNGHILTDSGATVSLKAKKVGILELARSQCTYAPKRFR